MKLSETGSKDRQNSDEQLEAAHKALQAYYKRRRKFPRKLYTTDVDMIEWRAIDGKLTPIALLELSHSEEFPLPVSYPPYLDSILERYYVTGAQAEFATHVARAIHCPAYLVVFRLDMTVFMVHELGDQQNPWHAMTSAEYRRFIIQGLEKQYLERNSNP